ncbi:uncharacterized protein [Henckelia pumila]|uniref:uncharacterized protein n=1 Tax=Henckelia pumila TaxID=405737 RepID=UPI003C6E2F84
MAGRKDGSLQSISVQLDGKSYSYWGYVMKNFLRKKSMRGYVTGVCVCVKPTDTKAANYAKLLDTWEADNAKIMTWINNFVTHSIGAHLAKYETDKEVWDHLEKLYTQSNFSKQYQLEADIHALRQNDMELWENLALTKSSALRAFPTYITHRDEQHQVQFLMALHDDFEVLRGTILHRSPLSSVYSVVHEFLIEEICFKSQADKGTIAPSTQSVFAAPQRPPPHNQNIGQV